MLAAKAEWSYTDYARSWLNGAQMLLQTGTTTVADIEAVPELLPEMWDATPLRVFSFLEMTGVRSKREPTVILSAALEKIDSLAHPRCRAALSPHAPYSTSPELLRLCANAAREKNLLLTTHVAESEQEFDMFAHAGGEMFKWLDRNGRDMADCGLGSPVLHVKSAGLLGENFLAVHVNCIADGDVELLGHNRVHIVHCPRSHDYFRHPPFSWQELAGAGVNLCLGTDSLATVRKTGKEKVELNMFSEMQALAGKGNNISPTEILRMATVNGAKALGMAGQIGELSANAFADLIAIPFNGKISGAAEAIVQNSGKISAGIIGGEWTIR
jgi:cytosine/adenosine deaminase-related metal-dependent hydrolase